MPHLQPIAAAIPTLSRFVEDNTPLSFAERYGWGLMILAGFGLMIAIGLIILSVSSWYNRHHPAIR